MNAELLAAFATFAFVSSVTPGPNNLMLLASGANFGLVRTIPHMLGIGIGFTVMIVLVGVGLMQVFDAVPASYTILKIVSVAYLLWLAFKIANAGARLILDPDWEPVVWTETERKKGQAWGLKTIESFHTHGTPPAA